MGLEVKKLPSKNQLIKIKIINKILFFYYSFRRKGLTMCYRIEDGTVDQLELFITPDKMKENESHKKSMCCVVSEIFTLEFFI